MAVDMEGERAGTAGIVRLPFGSPVAEVAEICRRDGGLILTGMIGRDDVDAINRDLDPAMDSFARYGSGFLGRNTRRLSHIVKRSATYRDKVLESDRLLEYVTELLPGRPAIPSLFATICIEVGPGEKAQQLHRDSDALADMVGVQSRDGPTLVVNTLLALTDITEDMGATRFVPGSHAWEDYSAAASQEQSLPSILDAGDMLFYLGQAMHGAGANTTGNKTRRQIATGYSVPCILGEEAWPFVLPVEEVRTWSPRLQSQLGFRTISQFLWRAELSPLEDYLKL